MYAVIFYMQIPQEIIAMKRACRPVSRAQIERLLTGVVSGGFRDYQVSALAVGAAVHLLAVGRGAITYSAQLVPVRM
tara:strand:+ start:1022 stop:1252 length:231 start_codon:yes stop_codon:yes gene_type:complete